MKFRRCLISALWLAVLYTIWPGARSCGSPARLSLSPNGIRRSILVKPYLQIGDAPPGARCRPRLTLARRRHRDCLGVEYQLEAEATAHVAVPPTWRRIAVPGIAPHRLFRGILKGLPLGRSSRTECARERMSSSRLRHASPKAPGQSFRFVSFGDCGAGTAQQKAIAYQTYLAHPDFLMITGDIVYGRGRISEYREKFWPVYNADEASPLVGSAAAAFDPLRGCAGQP